MALRKGKGRKSSNDLPNEEEFDIAPLTVKETSSLKVPVGGLLTPDKVAAVRFQQDRPGYAFPQVEAFVEQTQETLAYWESKDHQNQLELHELDEQLRDSMEHRELLQATIEVFKTKGDPLLNADGSYMTESQVGGSDGDLVFNLREENARLKKELSKSLKDAKDAWESEGILREYLEKELMPFTQAQAKELETLKSGQSKPQTGIAQDFDGVEPLGEAESHLEELEVSEEVILPKYAVEESSIEESPVEPKKPLFNDPQTLQNISDKTWEDARSIEEEQEQTPKLIATDEAPSAPAVPVRSADSNERRKSILLQSPEVVEIASNNGEIEIREETKSESENMPRPHLLALAPEVSAVQEE